MRARKAALPGGIRRRSGWLLPSPPLPADFKARVMAARAGDLDAIGEMREIGERIPPHMHVAFAEMVERMLGEPMCDYANSGAPLSTDVADDLNECCMGMS
jgi:hypothetical protein